MTSDPVTKPLCVFEEHGTQCNHDEEHSFHHRSMNGKECDRNHRPFLHCHPYTPPAETPRLKELSDEARALIRAEVAADGVSSNALSAAGPAETKAGACELCNDTKMVYEHVLDDTGQRCPKCWSMAEPAAPVSPPQVPRCTFDAGGKICDLPATSPVHSEFWKASHHAFVREVAPVSPEPPRRVDQSSFINWADEAQPVSAKPTQIVQSDVRHDCRVEMWHCTKCGEDWCGEKPKFCPMCGNQPDEVVLRNG